MVHFGNFVLGLTVSLRAFTAPFSLAVWTPAEGQPQMIGSLQPIVAAPGDDVILPCHLKPNFNVEWLTVEWSKPDLKPDPSDKLRRVEYVHLYRDRREDLDMKIQSYVGRTKLFTDEPDGLRRGNVSLKIKNVTLADEGRYRCFIPKLNSRVKESVVRLAVEPNSVQSWTTETPLHPRNLPTPDPKEDVKGGRSNQVAWILPVVVCVFVILVGVPVCACLLKRKRQKQNLLECDVAPNKLLPA